MLDTEVKYSVSVLSDGGACCGGRGKGGEACVCEAVADRVVPEASRRMDAEQGPGGGEGVSLRLLREQPAQRPRGGGPMGCLWQSGGREAAAEERREDRGRGAEGAAS